MLDAELAQDDTSANSSPMTSPTDPALRHRAEPYSPGEVRGNSSTQNRQTPAPWQNQIPDNLGAHNRRTNGFFLSNQRCGSTVLINAKLQAPKLAGHTSTKMEATEMKCLCEA